MFGISGKQDGSKRAITIRDNGFVRMGLSTHLPSQATFEIQGDGANNILAISTGTNSSNIVVTLTGNVGIGTTAPIKKLEISSGTIHMAGTGTPAKGAALCLTAAGTLGTCTAGTFDACTCTAP